MKVFSKASLACMSLAVAAAGGTAQAAKPVAVLDVDAIEAEFGGRAMFDGATFDNDGVAHDGGWEIRRLRFYGQGTIGDYKGKVQIDFSGGDVSIKDAYIAKKAVGGSVTLGHFKQPIGLEGLTSSKYITFMERGFGSETIATSRKMGAGYNRHGNNYSFAASLYDTEDLDEGDAVESGTGVGARLTWAPHTDHGNVTHFGVSLAQENNSTFAAKVRPEAHLGEKLTLADLGSGDVHKHGLEFALVRGPFSFQTEYMGAKADPEGGSEEELRAFYAQGSWFVNGTRAYKAKKGAFDRVKPVNGCAYELALRYDEVENKDTGVEADAITLGLNIHTTSHTRWMFNLVDADMNGDQPSVAQVRYQIDF